MEGRAGHGEHGPRLVVVHEHGFGAKAFQELHLVEEGAPAPRHKHHPAPYVLRIQRDVLCTQILIISSLC